jgi:sugar/nucleoside kinase (ribokinase family)
MPNFDVCSAGLYVLDILGYPISEVPSGGNVAFIEDIRLTVAGTAGGTAINSAKLGLKTRAAGAVGGDGKARFVLDALASQGIDVSAMQRIAGVPTSATILPIRPNGERPALHRRGASDHFSLTDQLLDLALDARFVHLGGTGLLRAFDGPPSVEFLKAAKNANRVTTFDLIAATADTQALIEPLLPYVDYFIPSIEEANALSGHADPGQAAQFFLNRGVKVCVLTLGEKGSYIAAKDGAPVRLPAFDIPVIDTTGCGDAYSAGFIAGLSSGWDLESCGKLWTAAAALVASGLGSDAGVISLEKTVEAMRTLSPKS